MPAVVKSAIMPAMSAERFRYEYARPWGRMSFLQCGGGEPIVFLHSAGRSALDFSALLPTLSNSRRCLAPDLCGHGESDLPHREVTVYSLAEDVRDWLGGQYLGRCALVGHGIGGVIALELLRQFPEVVGKIVLLDTFLPDGRRQELFDEDLVPEYNRARLLQFRQTLARWPVAYWEAFLLSARGYSGRDFLRQTMREILFVNAARRRPNPPTAAGLGLPRRDNLLLHWLDAAGHYFPQDEPAATGHILHRYLIEDSTDFSPAPPGSARGPDDDATPPTLSELMLR